MTILNRELSHFPPLKKQTQTYKGVDSAILASQPFLLITKPTEENRTHPPQSLRNTFLLLLLMPVLEQRHWWNNTHTREECMDDVGISFPSERNRSRARFSTGPPVALRNVLSRSTSSAEPLFLNSSWFYLYVFPYRSCTSPLPWRGSERRKATGRTMDTRFGASTQSKASSHELPMICIAEVTFYPGCAIAVI